LKAVGIKSKKERYNLACTFAACLKKQETNRASGAAAPASASKKKVRYKWLSRHKANGNKFRIYKNTQKVTK
jgi:hypothetical protein